VAPVKKKKKNIEAQYMEIKKKWLRSRSLQIEKHKNKINDYYFETQRI
jgi:hypothetical protein